MARHVDRFNVDCLPATSALLLRDPSSSILLCHKGEGGDSTLMAEGDAGYGNAKRRLVFFLNNERQFPVTTRNILSQHSHDDLSQKAAQPMNPDVEIE